MKNTSTLILTGILAAAPAFASANDAAADKEREALIERGAYLSNRLVLCFDCHTPRDEKGNYIEKHWLMGAHLPFVPTVEMPWTTVAPPVAGLPSMTEEQGIRFFMTGERPDGTHPRPPMPEFRFNEQDARAMVAYLKSLKPGEGSGAKAAQP